MLQRSVRRTELVDLTPAATRGDQAIGHLGDGTAYFAPLGELPYDPDEDRVQCHLCGDWFRSLGSRHLMAKHGWTVAEYRDRFQLLKQTPTCSPGVSERLRVHTLARIAAGELQTRNGYDKPPGGPGRGVRRERSLAALRPELLAELHPTRNPGLDPFRIGVKSGKRLWWRCATCGHEWQAAPHGRSRGNGCPACGQTRRTDTSKRVSAGRSLAVKRPDLLAELHPTLNPDIDRYSLGAGSRQKIWWRCNECGNEWQAAPTDRSRGRGCPACAKRRGAAAISERKRRVPPERSLASRRPHVARQLHPSRNPDVDPQTLAAYSNRKIWWLCPACGHEWQIAPNARGDHGKCPRCHD
jgi:rubrerythrin